MWKLWIPNTLSNRLFYKVLYPRGWVQPPGSSLKSTLNNWASIGPWLVFRDCWISAWNWNCNFEERPLTFSKPGARSNHWASSDYAIQNARYMTLEGDHFPFTGICYEIVVWTAQFWFLGLFILNIVTVIFGNLLEVNWKRTITKLHNTTLAETWLWRNYFNLE